MIPPLALALAAFAAPGALAPSQDARPSPARNPAHWDSRKDTATRLAFRKDRYPLSGALEEKIQPAPAELLEHLRADNFYNRFPTVPRAAELSADERARLLASLRELPAWFRQAVNHRLHALIPVAELGSSGYTLWVYGSRPGESTQVVVFDPRILELTPSAWLSWKDSTAFRPEPGFRIEAIAREPGDGGGQGQITLLHEFAHVLAPEIPEALDSATPLEEFREGSRFTFSLISWAPTDGHSYVSRWEENFPARQHLSYYRGEEAEASASDAPMFFAQHSLTDFPTLYAALAPWEDFADSVASFLYTVDLGHPWRVSVVKENERVAAVDTCWEHPRCATKRAALEAILARFGRRAGR